MINFNFFTKRKAEKAFTEVKRIFDDLFEENNTLNKRLAEFDNDKEVKKAKQKTADAHRNSVYVMEEKEKENVQRFIALHKEECKMKRHFRYIVSPTPLGNVLEVECIACEKKEDVTNYDHW